jgi:hypothetical protein
LSDSSANDSSLGEVALPEPIQMSTITRVRPPLGVSPKDWKEVIELAVGYFRKNSGNEPTFAALKLEDIDRRVSERTWQLLSYKHNWKILQNAFSIRGIAPLGRGLSAAQTLCIDMITNPLDRSSLATKLKKAGVTQAQYNEWMFHDVFLATLQERAERNLNTAAPLVTMALTHGATSGDLLAIKYFDQRAGRDPNKTETLDGARVVKVVIDSLTRHLSADHPELLRAIAADIEVGIKFDGE